MQQNLVRPCISSQLCKVWKRERLSERKGVFLYIIIYLLAPAFYSLKSNVLKWLDLFNPCSLLFWGKKNNNLILKEGVSVWLNLISHVQPIGFYFILLFLSTHFISSTLSLFSVMKLYTLTLSHDKMGENYPQLKSYYLILSSQFFSFPTPIHSSTSSDSYPFSS